MGATRAVGNGIHCDTTERAYPKDYFVNIKRDSQKYFEKPIDPTSLGAVKNLNLLATGRLPSALTSESRISFLRSAPLQEGYTLASQEYGG